VAEFLVELEPRIRRIAADRESGASELLDEVIAVLRDALSAGVAIGPVARAVCRAQPSMAPVWNAALAAVAAPERFERFARRAARGPAAMTRFAAECFAADDPGTPLHIVTLSFSRSVAIVLESLARTRPLRVACSESRPALEGRRLAARLAAEGTAITCFSDAAIAHALAAADAVLVGADAVSPEWFLNKSGTRMLAAAAGQQGVPVYVAATRDKFVTQEIAARLLITEGASTEIWDAPPPGVTVRNPYFEQTPLDLVTSVISDIGILGAGTVPDVCAESHDASALRELEEDRAGQSRPPRTHRRGGQL
jgi:translation initiation factor 2B subunit (eIF-2B alpha/beta/delta family)